MREKVIERKLIQAVRQCGGLALKFVSPGFNGVPDRLLLFPGRANLLRPPVADASQEVRSAETSDLHGCAVAPIEVAGRVAFVEVKAPGEKPRPLQVHRMEQLRRMGFPEYVIDGVEQIAEIISDAKSLPLEGKVAACGRMRCNSSSERSSK